MRGGRSSPPDRRSVLRGVLGFAAFGGLTTSTAFAQEYPARNITLVVPFPPGGSPDILARLISHKLENVLKKPIVIENRGGAGGTIAAEGVSRAPADGYTLLMGHIGTLAVAVGIYPNLRYDPVKSFQPISMVARVNNVLVINPLLPIHSVQDLIDYARKNPKQLNYGSGGNGSAAHIAMEAFADAAKIELMHVPYRGTNPSVTDVIAGHVQLTLTGATAVLEHVRAGKLRGLGVAGPQRLASAPDIPTIAETLPGFEASQWYGVVAPAGTPEPVVQKLNTEIPRTLAMPDVVESLERDGAQAWATSPEEFSAFIVQEIARWSDLIRRANIRVE